MAQFIPREDRLPEEAPQTEDETTREGFEVEGSPDENADNARHRKLVRLLLLILFIHVYLGLSVVFRLVLHRSIVYTHFAYIPIILAGVWWGRKAIIVALVLAAEMFAFRFSGVVLGELWGDVARVVFFLIIAVVVGELSRRVMLGQETVKRREALLRKANRRNKHLSRIRRDFLHIAVHDLQSPISAADMIAHSLEAIRTDPTEQERHLMERLHQRLGEATDFLKEFQFFAALDSRSIARHARDLDTAAILRQVVDRNQDLADRKGHDLGLSLEEDLPPVRGIERLVIEVVTNLVTNAIRYTPDGGTILVRAYPKDGRVRIEVEDDGIGISPKEQKLLFKEFTRLRRDDQDGKKIPGIGLGLSIVKRVTELHGGTVDLHSEVGKGSIFGVEFPSAGERAPISFSGHESAGSQEVLEEEAGEL